MGQKMYFPILTALSIFLYIPCISTVSIAIEKPNSKALFSLALVYEHDKDLPNVELLKKMFTGTGVFTALIFQRPAPASSKVITEYLNYGCGVVLFISSDKDRISWRLYDATQAQMLIGKTTGTEVTALTIRLVADAVFTYLFNQPSYFLTKIAYVKKSPTMRNFKKTEVCILDPVDGTSRTIIKDSRILVAPQWARPSASDKKIWLTISEFTSSNVRLMGLDLDGHVWPIIDAPGTCVGVAQQDRDTFVYCRSGGIWLYTFDWHAKKGTHTRITHKNKVCGCPSLLSHGDIIYSCNGNIERYNKETQQTTILPLGGYVLSPDVHRATDNILFSKKVQGVLQLFSTDVRGKSVTQLTYSPGDKVDASWSACGNYIAYKRCFKGHEQIAIFNCMTGTEQIVTPEDQLCGYPTWSEPQPLLYG